MIVYPAHEQMNGRFRPFVIQNTGESFYTFDGLMMYCHTYWQIGIELFTSEQILHWIVQELKDVRLEIQLQAIMKSEEVVECQYCQMIQMSVLFEQEDLSKLQRTLHAWLEMDVQTQLEIKGNTFMTKGLFGQALIYYRQAEPTRRILHNMAVIWLYLGLYEKANQMLLELLESLEEENVWLSYLKCQRLGGHKELQEKTVQQLLVKFPQNWEVWYEAGQMYLSKNRMEESLTALIEAYHLSKNLIIAVEITELLIREDHRLALPLWYKTIRLKQPALCDYLEAKEAFQKKNQTLGFSLLEKSLEADHLPKAIYLYATRKYQETNQIIKAIEYLTSGYELYPNDYEMIFEMLTVAKKAGQMKEYQEHLKTLLTSFKRELRLAYAK